MKLRTKFAVVLLLITVVLSGAVYGGLELYKDQVVEQNRNDVEETATLSARQLDATVEDRKDFVGFVASRPDATRFDRSDRFLAEFVDNSRFFAAQIVDDDGTIVDFHGDVTQDVQEESIGSDISDRPYVANALEGEVFVSEPEYVDATDQYLVVISAPIFDERRVKGALAAALYLDDQTFFGGLAPVSGEDQRVTVRTESDTLYQRGDRAENAIGATETVESTGWTVTVDRDRSNLLEQLRQLAIAQGLGILLVMLSVVSFGVWEYRTTLAQTEKLLAGFSALQDGDFDYELSLANAEEWEQISDGFNTLATGLASRETVIRQRGQRLDVLNRVLRHNLRNDAAKVLGYVDEIRRLSTSREVLDAADRIEATGETLEELSQKARELDFTMRDRDGPVRIDAVELVEDVLESVREEFPRVEVQSSVSGSAWVRADISLRSAVANVCENACEHNDALYPYLNVALERQADTVTIEVTDNGAGIPEHEWLVLDAGEETPLEHGSGLGLWIAQWAVERSGGSLGFDTDDQVGTKVTIELQAADPDEGGPERHEPDPGDRGTLRDGPDSPAERTPSDTGGRETVGVSATDWETPDGDVDDSATGSSWEWVGTGDEDS